MGDSLNRRRLLNRTLIGVTAAFGAAASIPLIGYLIGPLRNPEPAVWRNVGGVDTFKVGETVGVEFEDPSTVPWSGKTSKSLAWLRRVDDKSFIAFALNCTHLGCPVSWESGANHFFCPCHGGVFTAEGLVAGGPPPQPLWRHSVRLNKGNVEIETRALPVS